MWVKHKFFSLSASCVTASQLSSRQLSVLLFCRPSCLCVSVWMRVSARSHSGHVQHNRRETEERADFFSSYFVSWFLSTFSTSFCFGRLKCVWEKEKVIELAVDTKRGKLVSLCVFCSFVKLTISQHWFPSVPLRFSSKQINGTLETLGSLSQPTICSIHLIHR